MASASPSSFRRDNSPRYKTATPSSPSTSQQDSPRSSGSSPTHPAHYAAARTGGPSMSKIAIVTGANQGLGLALVRGLCRTLGTDGIVYLTARDRKRGEQAVGGLEAEGLLPRLELLDVRD